MNTDKPLVRIDSDFINQSSTEKLKRLAVENFLKLAPAMTQRQKEIGSLGQVLEDGNYFDLFIRARDNYIFGWFSSTLVLSRITAEQVCIKLLEDNGFPNLKWESKAKQKQKTLDGLIAACKTNRLLIKEHSSKLGKIKDWSERIIHAKGQLKSEEKYEANAFSSLRFLGQIISEKFDYIAKTKKVSGYKYIGQTERL